jgi:PII-like signaling protein
MSRTDDELDAPAMFDQPCLKLTTYFGERDRTAGGLLADQLLRLFASRRVRTSVLMRGIEGFGIKHHLHTDQLLTLSEDLPVVAVGVDLSEKIDELLPDVLAIREHRLVTLERARLLSADVRQLKLAEITGEATKLTIYVGRQERMASQPAFVGLSELLYQHGLSGATVLLGVDGTKNGSRERARLIGRNANVPMMIIAVGPTAAVANVAPRLREAAPAASMTIERVRICKRDGELIAAPHELPGTDEHGLSLWQKLTVHSSERALHHGRPLHRALIEALRKADIAGATCIRGIWGFHGDHRPHGDRLLQVSRHTPVVTIIVDTPQRITGAFGVIDEMTNEGGLVTSEMVPAAEAVAPDATIGGTRLARCRHWVGE